MSEARPSPSASRARWSGGSLLGAVVLSLSTFACEDPEGSRARTGALEGCPVRVVAVAHLGTLEDSEGIRGEGELYVVPRAPAGWAVLEPLSTPVLRYSADGSFAGPLSRAGQGPGELSRPRSLVWSPSGELWVADAQGRWVAFDADEEPVRTVSVGLSLAMHGFEADDEVFTLHLAAHMPAEDTFGESAFFAHRWDLAGNQLDPLGPGVDLLPEGPRVASVGSPHRLLHREGLGYLLAANFEGWGPMVSFPGAPAIHLWEGNEARVLVAEDALVRALGFPRRRGRPEFLMHALGPTSEGDSFWAFAHLKRDGSLPGLEVPPDEGATLRNSPALRNRMFEGVAWRVGMDGVVECAILLPVVPDGVVGPDTFFSVGEDVATGFRDVTVWVIDLN
jgi:hypothetical protein